jgi:exosortase
MATEQSPTTTVKDELKQMLPAPPGQVAWIILVLVFAWFHWESFASLYRAWVTTDDYGHGFLVPLFSAFLLWHRRDMLNSLTGKGSWWGVVFFALWAVMRWGAAFFNYMSVPEYAMLPFLMGVALFVGGWRGLHWAWPAIVFLFFMIPLPGAVQGLVSQQLQSVATKFSLFVIQTIGIPAAAQGHTIQLSDAPAPLEVEQACSGIRMMMLFFAICIGGALLVRRPLWEKLLIVASAGPIAIIANMIRIVTTAVVSEIARNYPSVFDYEKTTHFVHNWAGYAMMIVGLILLWVELWLLSKILVAPPPDRPLMTGGVIPGMAPMANMERVVRRRRT